MRATIANPPFGGSGDPKSALRFPRKAVPERPGGPGDNIPVDLAEVEHGTLREVLERVKSGRPVFHLQSSGELRYGGTIGPRGALQLGQALHTAAFLIHLILPNQRIRPAGGAAIAHGRRPGGGEGGGGMSFVMHVDLRSNELREGATAFGPNLNSSRPSRLRKLCLDANHVDSQAWVLAAALAERRRVDPAGHAMYLSALSLTGNPVSS
jgi:hypothetical protein